MCMRDPVSMGFPLSLDVTLQEGGRKVSFGMQTSKLTIHGGYGKV